jgi:hypothetical protein
MYHSYVQYTVGVQLHNTNCRVNVSTILKIHKLQFSGLYSSLWSPPYLPPQHQGGEVAFFLLPEHNF